ncbi:fibronectin type III domain-containing protein [Micromonospora avicenniae]|uniref:fibronectin type III domain-containing protein n=1 Tax=Micromonospora avicenniae TaxID=1198245 RepID=UPI00331A7BE5
MHVLRRPGHVSNALGDTRNRWVRQPLRTRRRNLQVGTKSRFVHAISAVILATGFVGAIADPAAAYPLCDQPDPPLACEAPTDPPPPPPPTGTGSPNVSLDSVTRQPGGLSVGGTGFDPNTGSGIQIQISIDGSTVGTLVTNPSTKAYSGILPARAGSQVCATAVNVGAGSSKTVCRAFTVRVNPFGSFDEVSSELLRMRVRVKGWLIDPDTANPISLYMYIDGRLAGAGLSSLYRPEVGTANPGYGSAHGFDLSVPADFGTHYVCLHGINVGAGDATALLGCKTVSLLKPALPKPTNLTATVVGTSVTLSWTDNAVDEEQYRISGVYGLRILPAHSGTGPMSYQIGGLVPGITYCASVVAYNSDHAEDPARVCFTGVGPDPWPY